MSGDFWLGIFHEADPPAPPLLMREYRVAVPFRLRLQIVPHEDLVGSARIGQAKTALARDEFGLMPRRAGAVIMPDAGHTAPMSKASSRPSPWRSWLVGDCVS